MWRRFPASAGLLGLIAAVFLAMESHGGSQRVLTLVQFGALVRPLVAAGEHWRLVTALFVHIGWWHVLVNGYALYQLGPLCENFFGSARVLAIFLACGIGGSVASASYHEGGLSAGASGAIFGLVGLLVTMALRQRTLLHLQLRRSLLRSLLPVLVVNLALGFLVPEIDNMAHLGGLCTGAVLGWCVRPGRGRATMRVVCLIGALGVIGWASARQWEVVRSMDAAYLMRIFGTGAE